MKKIAIITSSQPAAVGEAVNRLVASGSRYRVSGVYVANDIASELPELGELLKNEDVDFILTERLASELPADIAETYRGRIVKVDEEYRDADREAERCLRSIVALETPPPVPTPQEVDRQWADVLKVEYKEENILPPPVPEQPTPEQTVRGQAPLNGEHVEYRAPLNPRPPRYSPRQAAPHSPAESEPMPPTYLIWSVLATVFCCMAPGIVAILFSSMVSSKYYAGDIEGAKRASRNAEIWIIASFILGLISGAVMLPLMFV